MRVGACRLGSRLYYEFMATVLGDAVAWERLADSVAVEVRRHGAPAPVSPDAAPKTTPPAVVAAPDGMGEAAAPAAAVLTPMALLPTATRAVAAPTGMGASTSTSSLVMHVDNRSSVTNASNFGNSSKNIANNSIVLL